MQLQSLPLQDTLRSLPPEWDDDPLPHIEAALKASGRKIVILDDDVMGTQSVHNIAVLMDWSVGALRAELEADSRAFFVVTNARTMPESQAQTVNSFVTHNLCEAARQAGVDFSIVSRLDSTLRGHFPAEMQAIQSALPSKPDGWIIAPLFLEGGRYTINDIQYVSDGEWLTPVGDTEFARDPAFAFKHSALKSWIEEKTSGQVPADAVASVSIGDLRNGGHERVAVILSALTSGGVCVVNGASNRDMEVFVQGLLDVEVIGQRFLFRAAASFIKALLGQSERPLLTPADMGIDGSCGALIVVGSHVPRTTQQLDHLLANTDSVDVEANVASLLSASSRQAEIERVTPITEDAIKSGSNAVLYTSRKLVEGRSADHSLAIGHQVSHAISEVVAGIRVRPRCVIVKGGATSYAVATKALNVRRAWSPGQPAPGVPAWILGDETLHPGMPCIIFPGNVGGEDSLTKLVARLDVK
jgi:uncharacterized protein YgbK (DUF1537 family)